MASKLRPTRRVAEPWLRPARPIQELPQPEKAVKLKAADTGPRQETGDSSASRHPQQGCRDVQGGWSVSPLLQQLPALRRKVPPLHQHERKRCVPTRFRPEKGCIQIAGLVQIRHGLVQRNFPKQARPVDRRPQSQNQYLNCIRKARYSLLIGSPFQGIYHMTCFQQDLSITAFSSHWLRIAGYFCF